ncbi:uncharacterized protein V1510DRAFT_424228 [Dipodascopsis tothii]|uniref:uncharacterized protein n=1 Tax=Dipodascopsis tothii TaxID=44089 RepID=UPI0034CEFD01
MLRHCRINLARTGTFGPALWTGRRLVHASAVVRETRVLNQATAIKPSKGGALQDFDMLQDLPRPPVSVDTVGQDSFTLSNGDVFTCQDGGRGLAIIGAETYAWDFQGHVHGLDAGLVDIDPAALGVWDVLFPRPELLLVGLGAGRSRILGPRTREFFRDRGYLVEVTDTVNAASNFELLATERPGQVGLLMLPPSA